MPFFLKRELPNKGEIGLWRIDEDQDYFLKRMDLFPEEQKYFGTLKGRRPLEYLASRYLLHLMSGRRVRAACLKDDKGKPYLKDSNYHISFSHSHDFVAVIASPDPVGVDIQKLVPKISRITHKFISEKEFKMIRSENELDYFHILWGAKESLFKVYGRKEVDFNRHLFIDSFNWSNPETSFTGYVKKEDHISLHHMTALKIENYMLVYSVQSEPHEN